MLQTSPLATDGIKWERVALTEITARPATMFAVVSGLPFPERLKKLQQGVAQATMTVSWC